MPRPKSADVRLSCDAVVSGDRGGGHEFTASALDW